MAETMKWLAPILTVGSFCMILAGDRLVEGAPSSAVRVVVFEDLQCSDCALFRAMLDAHLLPKYGAQVAFEHRDFPLPKHVWARDAAIAARYFEQRKPAFAVDFRRLTLARMKEIPPGGIITHIQEFAKSKGLDPAQAVASLRDVKLHALVDEDYQDGIARGIGKTPTVLVGDLPFIETFTLEEISKAIDDALRQAKAAK
jgi:protein-disulfide isomerase